MNYYSTINVIQIGMALRASAIPISFNNPDSVVQDLDFVPMHIEALVKVIFQQ